MIGGAEVLKYVGGSQNDLPFAEECAEQAQELVDAFVGASAVPSNVVDRAVLETSSELFHRKNAPSGIVQFAGVEGTVPRLSKDPMTSSYALLNKYVVGF